MEVEKNKAKSKNTILTIVFWTARIWGALTVVFLIFFVGAQVIGSGIDSNSFSLYERIAFTFFPVGLTLGLIIAFWRSGLGGIIATICIVAFHVTMFITNGDPDFVLFIDLLAVPGPLFVIHWLVSNSKEKQNEN